MKQLKKMICIVVLLALCMSGCTEKDEQGLVDQAEINEFSDLTVYTVGRPCTISYADNTKKKEHSSPVTIGLETTSSMPGYTEGNAIYQALLDYAEENHVNLEVKFFDFTYELVEQLEEDFKSGTVPDLVLESQEFEGDWVQLLEKGAFEDLAPYLQINSDIYYKSVMDSGKDGESQYVVPFLFNVNGYITSAELLQEVGTAKPEKAAAYEEIIYMLQDVCIGLSEDKSREAIYAACSMYEGYIATILMAAAGYNGLTEGTSIQESTVRKIYETMDYFYRQEFITIPNYDAYTFEENSASSSNKYFRLAGGPTVHDAPDYKPGMVGVQLDGGYAGPMIYSSFLMQVYTMQSYYQEKGLTPVIGGIPLDGEINQYSANVTGFGFCPKGAQNVEAAGKVMQYLIDYEFPIELGFSIRRENVEEDIQELTETSMKFYVLPEYDPYSSDEIRQEKWDEEAVWFQPMSQEEAEIIRNILDHIEGASLPYQQPANELTENMRKYMKEEITKDEAVEKTMIVLKDYWER